MRRPRSSCRHRWPDQRSRSLCIRDVQGLEKSHVSFSLALQRRWSVLRMRLLTIDEGVENVLPVLLNQVVDVSEDSTAVLLASLARVRSSIDYALLGNADLPHDCGSVENV